MINAERDRVDAGADVANVAQFFDAAALALMGRIGNLTVLDFGCGDGALVADLRSNGWTAFGCDFPGVVPEGDGLRAIVPEPYTLPFDDGTFDLVVSTSVLEHAANKRECFEEIARVLRPGGCAMHLYPPKWYLPREPHILVPLVNWFWPRCPRAWLALWTKLGIRNSFQATMTWRQAVCIQRALLQNRPVVFDNGTAPTTLDGVLWQLRPANAVLRRACGGRSGSPRASTAVEAARRRHRQRDPRKLPRAAEIGQLVVAAERYCVHAGRAGGVRSPAARRCRSGTRAAMPRSTAGACRDAGGRGTVLQAKGPHGMHSASTSQLSGRRSMGRTENQRRSSTMTERASSMWPGTSWR